MEIIMTAFEYEGIYKIGGLGDYTTGLTKALSEIDDINLKVIMPKFKQITGKFEFITSCHIGDDSTSFPSECLDFDVYHTKINNTDVYLIENDHYFSHDFIYDYENINLRYGFYCRAIKEFIEKMNWKPDIIHSNDSSQGFLPMIYKKNCPSETLPKFVLTIHSIYFSANYKLKDEERDLMNYYLGFEWEGNSLWFLKEAIVWSDKLITVGKSNGEEIQTPEKGYGLDKYILENNGVTGLLNGIDYDTYPRIEDFDEFLANKQSSKLKLQKKFNLEENTDIPLLMYCGRLGGEQKGCTLLLDKMEDLMENGCQFILLGDGVTDIDKFEECSNKYDNFIACIRHDEELAKELYEASDILLMPSKCEPNGLSQIIAMHYGTVPVVHNTGGLKDTIIDCLEYEDDGNGFKFYNFGSDEFLDAVLNAKKIFENDNEKWVKTIENCYNEDYSWKKMSKPYVEIYESLMR